MALILPSLYSELEGPALGKIVEELSKVKYLSEIIVGLDRASKEEFIHAKQYFNRLPNVRVLWNDGPRLQAIDEVLKEQGLAPKELGKGRNVWYCFGYSLASGKSSAVALHDCDILTYSRSIPARLLYSLVHPGSKFKFAKGYYYRTDGQKLNGRVSRLLVTPLIRSLKKLYPNSEYLDYMDSFRYSLAGEFGMMHDVVRSIRIPSDWGLEIGVLSEMFRNDSVNRICQVDISDNYDHKHQILSPEDRSKGLSKMSFDISKSMFRKMATMGEIFSEESFRALKATYYRLALDFVDQYHADAMINGLKLDRHAEEQAVELFAQNIIEAGNSFLRKPQERPFMAPWNRVISALPDIMEDFYKAVEADWNDPELS